MINLDIDQIDIRKFQKQLRQYPIVIGRQFQRLIKDMTVNVAERNIVEAVRSGPTRAYKSGNLFRLIRNKIGVLQGEIISGAKYSLYVHSGTRYMRARPYMTKGLKDSEQQFNNLIKDFLNKVLK